MLSDVTIIGAGINGLLSALALAREGLHVSILERGSVAQESTWAGAGIVSPLLPWDYGDEVNNLSERGRQSWPTWIELIQERSRIDPEYHTCGMLALSIQAKAKAVDWCQSKCWNAVEPPAHFHGLFTAIDDGLWLPDVAQVRNPRLAQALLEACCASGVEVLPDTPALALNMSHNRINSIKTSRGDRVSGLYVLSTGAWSQSLLSGFAENVDIRPVRGQILLYKGTPGQVPFIVYQSGHYLVPRQDGLILVGSTLEQVGYDKSTTSTAKDALQAFALNLFPCLASAELLSHWAGLRPGSPGNIPTISSHPWIDNLYLNSGHFRYGVTMAPASAELLRDIILERVPIIDPAPYRWKCSTLPLSPC